MMKSNTLGEKGYECLEKLDTQHMMRKMYDRRRRSRKATALHPWRQYRRTEAMSQQYEK